MNVAFRGRALDNSLYVACARYAGTRKESRDIPYGYITNDYSGRIPSCPLGRAYVVDPYGHGLADTGYTGGGVATAVTDRKRL